VATKHVESIITKVELDSTGEHYILSTADNNKLPWLPKAYMQNWLVKNDVATYRPRQILHNAVITWEEKAVKTGEPVLDRAGKQVISKKTGLPAFYTVDHIRVENMVMFPSEEIKELENAAAVKISIDDQVKNLSAADKIKQRLAEKKAMRNAAAGTPAKEETPADKDPEMVLEEEYSEPTTV
jgi:hypothetical protein